MDKTILVKINGVERVLNYSIEVMFDMTEKYKDIKNVFDILGQDNKECFVMLRWFVVRMAHDGELCRREAGYEPVPFMTDADISMRMTPYDYEKLKDAVIEAIEAGYRREVVDANEIIDLGMIEIQAKKIKAGN